MLHIKLDKIEAFVAAGAQVADGANQLNAIKEVVTQLKELKKELQTLHSLSYILKELKELQHNANEVAISFKNDYYKGKKEAFEEAYTLLKKRLKGD